jgi:hypothetical protein
MKIKVIANSEATRGAFSSRFGEDFEYEFVTAFTTSEISDIEPLFAKSDIYELPRDQASIMARAKTHLKIWETIAAGTEPVAVLEDDVEYYSTKSGKVFWSFLQSWHYLEFDVFILDGEDGKTYLNVNGINIHPGKAYVMKPEGATKILEKIAKSGFTSSVGWELLESQFYLKLLAYEGATFVAPGESRRASRIDEHPITPWGEERIYDYDNEGKYLVLPAGWAESQGWLDRSRTKENS